MRLILSPHADFAIERVEASSMWQRCYLWRTWCRAARTMAVTLMLVLT